MSYRLDPQNQVIRIDDGATLPCSFENGVVLELDEHSPLVADFAVWVAAGNVPLPVPPPTVAQQIAAIDAQMGAAEEAKLLGRTAREDMVWRWVKDYIRDVMGINPFTIKDAADPVAVKAIAALTDPANPNYSAGFTRLKAFDDTFVALRAECTALQRQLAP